MFGIPRQALYQADCNAFFPICVTLSNLCIYECSSHVELYNSCFNRIVKYSAFFLAVHFYFDRNHCKNVASQWRRTLVPAKCSVRDGAYNIKIKSPRILFSHCSSCSVLSANFFLSSHCFKKFNKPSLIVQNL